jgi:V-type H+-transporting ATPase subunit E
MRLKVLAARESAIQEIVSEARTKLKEVSKNPASYKKLMIDLLVQAMKKLGEKQAVVRCRQVDLGIVKEILEPARKQYFVLFQQDAATLSIDQTFLAPPPVNISDEVESCCGGVVLCTSDGRINVNNTLDDRLKIAYDANQPTLRGILFGVIPAAR